MADSSTYAYTNLPKGFITKSLRMEKRILGILLSILGILGLVYAGFSFLNNGEGTRNIKSMIIFGLLGAIFFVAGISLIKNTKDKET